MAKIKLNDPRLGEYWELFRDSKTGIAWIEDGSTGNGHSAHPNIDATGSVAGMKSRGFWGKDDVTVKSHGFIYNVSHVVVDGELDRIAKEYCQCSGCMNKS